MALDGIMQFGFYFSTDRATTLRYIPTYGTRGMAELMVTVALKVPVTDLITPGPGLEQIQAPSERVELPQALRVALEGWDKNYLPDDESVKTTKKQLEVWGVVKGAHVLLAADKSGTLRHYGVEALDVEETLKANIGKKYFGKIRAQLGELQRERGLAMPNIDESQPTWTFARVFSVLLDLVMFRKRRGNNL